MAEERRDGGRRRGCVGAWVRRGGWVGAGAGRGECDGTRNGHDEDTHNCRSSAACCTRKTSKQIGVLSPAPIQTFKILSPFKFKFSNAPAQSPRPTLSDICPVRLGLHNIPYSASGFRKRSAKRLSAAGVPAPHPRDIAHLPPGTPHALYALPTHPCPWKPSPPPGPHPSKSTTMAPTSPRGRTALAAR